MSNILSSARSDTVGATSGERLRVHGMASRLEPGRGRTPGGDAAGEGGFAFAESSLDTSRSSATYSVDIMPYASHRKNRFSIIHICEKRSHFSVTPFLQRGVELLALGGDP